MKNIINFISLILTFSALSQNTIPNIDIKTLDGDDVNIKEVTNQDNVVIVSLWATWCVPCIKELDAICEVYPEWQKETNVELIAISVDDSLTVKRVNSLINKRGWDYNFLLDTNNDLKRALKASTVPLTLIIKDNKIVYRHSGYDPGSEQELYEKVKEFSK